MICLIGSVCKKKQVNMPFAIISVFIDLTHLEFLTVSPAMTGFRLRELYPLLTIIKYSD